MKAIFTLILLIGSHFIQAQDKTLNEAHKLLTDGLLEEALNLFNELEPNHQNNAEFYLLRGSCLSELGENSRAITDLDISISLDDKNPTAHYQRGFAKFSIGSSQEALSDFDKAISLSPDYGEAYLNRGTIQYDLENYEAACSDWQMALKSGLTLAEALLDQLCKN